MALKFCEQFWIHCHFRNGVWMQTTLQSFKQWRKNFWRLESRVTEQVSFFAVTNLHKHFVIFNDKSAQEALNSFFFIIIGIAKLYHTNSFKIFNSLGLFQKLLCYITWEENLIFSHIVNIPHSTCWHSPFSLFSNAYFKNHTSSYYRVRICLLKILNERTGRKKRK